MEAKSPALLASRATIRGHGLGKGLSLDTTRAYLERFLRGRKLLFPRGAASAVSLRDRTFRQSGNRLDARPKRCDCLLGHESLVRQSRHSSLDNKECSEAEDRKPPSVGYYDVIRGWQSFILGNFEEELHETREQRRAKVVDVLSSADAVSVLRSEEDVAELLWMANTELNQAARSRKKALFRSRIVSRSCVEVLNHELDRFAAQLGKNVPFVRKMLVDHGVRVTDLISNLTKRHGFVSAIGEHFACSRKDLTPQPLLALYPATW
jgi:hypothetical protein